MVEYTNSRIRELIAEYIHSDRDRLILALRLIDGWTFEKIASHPQVDMSDKQIKRIVYKLQEELFRHL